MAEDSYSAQEIFCCFKNAAIAVNKFCFKDPVEYTDYKAMKQELHLLSVIADDQLEMRLKDKHGAKTNHGNVIEYLKREDPDDDADMLKEYRQTADNIIREYSKLIGEAFR